MKIYVASSWRNEQQPAVVKALRDAGHSVYDFKNPKPGDKGFGWSEIDPNWKSWTAVDQIKCYEHPAAVRGLKNDFDAMKWADAFVMVQPCGRSAALELGWAIGAGKKTIVLMVDGQEPELMIRLADYLCLSIEEVLNWVRLHQRVSPKIEQRAPRICLHIGCQEEALGPYSSYCGDHGAHP
jgi:hypothetical protein